ncbi:hypothetical protein CYMTET_26398 [Cymbomonas tetramitiformis]|uniref:C3H1-type domain-containing protein n=1 Tax=Cymbomonas tetramitiformis TaxID=36881 RepID=A0AAE0KY31_9CHLO|nr:hypothetical protein CYMTET_26398 [Cymbomonas tetramitiformis]
MTKKASKSKVSKDQKNAFIDWCSKQFQADLRKPLMLADSYLQVKNSIAKSARKEEKMKEYASILENQGHFLDVVDRATAAIPGVGSTEPTELSKFELQEIKDHWEAVKQMHRSEFEAKGGQEAALQRKEQKKERLQKQKLQKKEREEKRQLKEAPERELKAQRALLKEKMHGARLGGVCLDFVKGHCDFGSKCKFLHEGKSGEAATAAAAVAAADKSKEKVQEKAEKPSKAAPKKVLNFGEDDTDDEEEEATTMGAKRKRAQSAAGERPVVPRSESQRVASAGGKGGKGGGKGGQRGGKGGNSRQKSEEGGGKDAPRKKHLLRNNETFYKNADDIIGCHVRCYDVWT